MLGGKTILVTYPPYPTRASCIIPQSTAQTQINRYQLLLRYQSTIHKVPTQALGSQSTPAMGPAGHGDTTADRRTSYVRITSKTGWW